MSPGSTSISTLSTTTAVNLKSDCASTVGQPAQRVEVDPQLEVVDRLDQPGHVGALVGQRRLVELDIALLDRRAQDDLAPDADGRRLRPGHHRRHRRPRGRWSPAPGRRAASPGRAARGRTTGCRAGRSAPTRRGSAPCTSCRCRGRRRWSRSRCRSSSRRRRRVTPGGTRTSRSDGANLSRTRPVPSWRRRPRRQRAGRSGPRAAVRRGRSEAALRRWSPWSLRRGYWCCGLAPRQPRPPAWRGTAAIQLPPHSSLPSSRSAALTASMICGVRASMMR